MIITIKMPALSPTMEEGALAKWLVKPGDEVKSGDILAEIETDKATMEFEAVDEGTIGGILVPEGTEGVKVGTAIATIESDTVGEPSRESRVLPPSPEPYIIPTKPPLKIEPSPAPLRIISTPLARRIAVEKAIDISTVQGSGPGGRIVKDDVLAAAQATTMPEVAPAQNQVTTTVTTHLDTDIPHEIIKLSNMRKTIARRLTESKQTIPHIYLTIDVRLDALLHLRTELNDSLASRNVKISVNDLIIKALAMALLEVPKCNVSFADDALRMFTRADISVAVSIDNGLITPIIADAGSKNISAISTEMSGLAAKAKAGKLRPDEYQGGTASLSNMGMLGIKQFAAVINPPQAMIMAIGAGEKRPVVIEDRLDSATVMSATGSFDHRAIDGADGAQLMQAFRNLIENPLLLLV